MRQLEDLLQVAYQNEGAAFEPLFDPACGYPGETTAEQAVSAGRVYAIAAQAFVTVEATRRVSPMLDLHLRLGWWPKCHPEFYKEFAAGVVHGHSAVIALYQQYGLFPKTPTLPSAWLLESDSPPRYRFWVDGKPTEDVCSVPPSALGPAGNSGTPPPPMWATDPTGRFEVRYWDGTTWTHHVSTKGSQLIDPL